MHRRTSLLVMAALAVILFTAVPLLARLQLNWLNQLHDSEMQVVGESLDRGVKAFQQEVISTFFNLSFLAASHGAAPGTESHAEHRRLETSAFPGLVRAGYLVEKDESGEWIWRRVLTEDGSSSVEPPPDSYLAAPAGSLERALDLVVVDDELLLRLEGPLVELEAVDGKIQLPSQDRLEDRSFVLLRLGLESFTTDFVPTLAGKHFPSWGAGFDYGVLVDEDGPMIVSSRSDLLPQELESPDREVPLLDPAAFGIDQVEEMFLSPAEEPAEEADSASCGPGISCRENRAVTTQLILSGGEARTTWLLRVRHRLGSVREALDATRKRNLALSLVCLGALAFCALVLVALAFTSQRVVRSQLEFVAGVSHELRTPLAVIHSAGSNLADGLIVEERNVRLYGEQIRREARRLRELFERVLAVTTSARGGLHLAPVPLAPLVARVVGHFVEDLKGAALEVRTVIPAELPAVQANAAALESALRNLISNAIKYGADGGILEIEAHHQSALSGGEICLAVRDRGRGIEAADRKHLFKPYFRGQRIRKDQTPGTGLGLSLVSQVMKAMGGRVSLDPRWHPGSAFLLTLPVAVLNEEQAP